jgi:thrombospondin type-1 domain-containing protein 4
LKCNLSLQILYTKPNPNIKYEFLTDTDPEESNEIPINTMPSHHTEPRHHRHHNMEPKKDLNQPKIDSSYVKRPDFKTLESQAQVNSNVIGDRKFIWKILSYTQCSRTCGGGLQIGKFRCVEATPKGEKEVPSAYCSGPPPPARRRRCGGAPCPPRWRAAAWGPCPVCGPAQRTRIVGCVQDHARGITKV